VNVDGLTNTHIDQSGKLGNELEKVGYDYDLQTTFDGPPLFVSGKTNVAHDISALEAARLTQEQDMQLVVLGRLQTAFMGMHIVQGSEWDPENTGGIQSTMDKATEQNAKVGILGWGVGDIPPTQLLMKRLWSKDFFRDASDFRVITTDPPVMPKLMLDGELSMGSTSATHGAASQLLNDEIKPLFFASDLVEEQGWGVPPLSDIVTRKEYYENNKEACKAIVEAVNRGTDWVYNKAINKVPQNSNLREILLAESPDAAEYALKYHVEQGTKYSPEQPTLWEENYVTDDWVERTKSLLRNAEDVDQLESGWEDKLEFARFD